MYKNKKRFAHNLMVRYGDAVVFEKRQAGTADDDYNIAEVLFISQIYNRV